MRLLQCRTLGYRTRLPIFVTTKQSLLIFCICVVVYVGTMLQYEHSQTMQCDCWNRDRKSAGSGPLAGSGNMTQNQGPDLVELKQLYQTLSQPWQLNVNKSTHIRQKLINTTYAERLLFLTQDTVNIGEIKRYTRDETMSFIVSEDFYNHLPKTRPINFSRVRKCSVVGNSGILKNSHCGTNIDKSDLIFRCNLQELKAYAVDAGRLSHFATMNHGIVWNRYERLKSKENMRQFMSDVSEFSGVIAVPLGGPRSITMGIRAMKIMKRNRRVHFAFFNPEHFLSHREFWKGNITSIMSTGMYLTSLAMTLCEEIDLYGFWPFGVDPFGHPIPFHYTEDIDSSRTSHDMPEEFRLLLDLHTKGIIRMHIGSCK